jgi:hypothetical protein
MVRLTSGRGKNEEAEHRHTARDLKQAVRAVDRAEHTLTQARARLHSTARVARTQGWTARAIAKVTGRSNVAVVAWWKGGK